jgi:putative NADH-flavin reductase
MKILIFGATGGTGTVLVDQALERGHAVTAFVRDRARLKQVHPALRAVVGDVMDPSTLDVAVGGQDAILCALGTMPESKYDRVRRQCGVPVCSVGARNIIGAMTRHEVRRIVVESSACVGNSRRTGRFGAGHFVHRLLHDVMDDKEQQETFIRDSALDWTIIRPVRLSSGARTGRVSIGDDLGWGLLSRVSRADVAAVMLDAMVDANTIKHAITVRS